jgi:uncharacterized membrane protein
MTEPGSIQRHLDELRNRLAELPDCERILAEVEDHLVEATADLQQAGLPAMEAEQKATFSFGDPKDVAERFERQLKQEEVMQSNKNLRGVRILAALFAFTAVTQSAGVIGAALSVSSLFWFALLQPLVHAVLAVGLWRHRSWSRKGLMTWSAVMALWGTILATQGLLIGDMLIGEMFRIPSTLLLPCGIFTICIAIALFRYMLRPGVRLHLTE